MKAFLVLTGHAHIVVCDFSRSARRHRMIAQEDGILDAELDFTAVEISTEGPAMATGRIITKRLDLFTHISRIKSSIRGYTL